VAIFERVGLQPRHISLYGLTTSLHKQTDLQSGRSTKETLPVA
jgi:hypothetical protein